MRIRSIIAAAAILAVTVTTGCSAASQPQPITLKQRAKLTEDIDPTIVQASNHLGLRLHEQLLKANPDQNIFLSPISISTAFAMAASGAKGATLKEMIHVLGWDGKTQEQVNAGYEQLLNLLAMPGSGIKLHIANSLWSDKNASLLASFTDSLQQYYAAEPKQIDMSKPQYAADQINNWVSQHTNAMIKKLIDADNVNANANLMLLNAVYFEGEWKKLFVKSVASDFYLNDGSKVTASYMSQSGEFEYKKTDTYEAIRLPYGEGQMAMLIVLPAKGKKLDDFQQLLWNGKLTVSDRWAIARGTIRLPKFKMEYSAKLVVALKSLGMKLPFDSTTADLSGITGQRDTFISDVLHKSIIEVDEAGTKAAAVTASLMSGASAPATEQFDMNVTRPFYFAIEDLQSGVQLFTGSMYNPVSEE